ncbi:hypothetical protein RNAN_2996 [Rheinheimera nanhaiensis E407-8]|uniref:Uncharacterized protein n=1 Tax=Rheinheimera nanhaiensis E407-8 TaxID=562729 RepID=I1E105_9GAMM|nr:hypothetical protein RNAN_2996 [Rheinheimera nanhaiensis E407-8]
MKKAASSKNTAKKGGTIGKNNDNRQPASTPKQKDFMFVFCE